jgi:MFS family permease
MKENKNLRYSFINGIFSSGMSGFSYEFLTPFLLLLGGTVKQIGALNAIPNLLGALAQFKGVDIITKIKSRKKTVVFFVCFEGIILLAVALSAYAKGLSPHLFILFIALYSICSAVVRPAWDSWISELVPPKNRASFFGRRSRVYGFVTMAATFMGGLILQKMELVSPFYGFAILFGIAFLLRMLGWFFLCKIYEPPLKHEKESQFTFYQFIARIKQSNFAKFVVFVALFSFSVSLASPFFAVFMIRDLQFSYLFYSIMLISSALARHLAITRWGIQADIIGNLKIIKFTALFIGIIPFLWIINRSPYFLLFAQMAAGFLWAGFYLCASNFIYDAVIPEKRARCIAYFCVLNGMALAAGAFLGGLILKYLPPLFNYSILTLFAISGIMRFLVFFIMKDKMQEVKQVQKTSNKDLFYSMFNVKVILGVDRRTIRY